MRRLIVVMVTALVAVLGHASTALAAPPVSSGTFELGASACSTTQAFPAGPHSLRADFAVTADGDDDVQVGDTITYTYSYEPASALSFNSDWTVDFLLPSGPTPVTTSIDPFTGGDVVSTTYVVQAGDAGTALSSGVTQVSVLNEDNDTTVTCTPPGNNTIDLYVNVAPTAVDDQITTTAGAPVAVAVLANDGLDGTVDSGTSDGPAQDGSAQDDQALADPPAIVTNASNGLCTVLGDEIVYESDEGFTGTDTCVYSITDNDGAVATATLEATVEAPAISVVKTVGTDDSTCATESSIVVAAGTTVYYCYTVTNDSTIAYDLHDLDDDQLGVLLDDFAFSLAPGASVDTVAAGLTVDAVIDVDTTNIATWTAVNSDAGVQAQGEATAIVEVAAPEIALEKTVGTDDSTCATESSIVVAAGTTVYYCYTVTNTGDVTLSVHDLVDDQLGTVLDDFAFDLAPGASVDTVAAGLTVDAVIDADTTNTATWTGFDDGFTTEATATATVEVAAPEIALEKTVGTDDSTCATESSIVVAAGTTVYYCYTVTNTGNVTLSVHDLVDDQLGTVLDDFAFDLAPGASVDTVAAGLTVDAVIDADTTTTATWTAGDGDGALTASADAEATVTVVDSVVTPAPAAQTLATTGASTSLLAQVALALLVAGGLLMRAARRRPHPEH